MRGFHTDESFQVSGHRFDKIIQELRKNIHVFQSIISNFRIPFKGLTKRVGRILLRFSSLYSPEAGRISPNF